MNTTVTSKQFRLNWHDALKGLIMGVGTPVLYFVQDAIPSWHLIPIEKVAISALITYLIKNFFTTSAIVVKGATDAQVKAVNQDKADVKVVSK
jgi:hypothetical protein